VKIIQPSEIVGLINDYDTILIPGITNCYAEQATELLAKAYAEKQHPGHLTLIWQAAIGILGGDRGISSLCQDGLFDVAYAGHVSGCGVPMTEFCRDLKAEFYNFPQGILIQMMRAITQHLPGVITKIGLGTYLDPRIDCARMNSVSTKSLVELIEIDGEEYLLYKAPKKVDISLIRGTYIDEDGNITIENEAYKSSFMMAAAAAKATGGKVIAQVEYVVKRGTMNPKMVEIPGMLVDYAYVADPYYHMQTGDTQYHPALSGQAKIPLADIEPIKMDEKKVMCRRAAMEIDKGDIVNLGVGTPEFIANVAAEEHCSEIFTLTSECGSIGGVPGHAHDFGSAWNAVATIESEDMMAIYDGGILDEGFLGFLQVGPNGNVNSSNRGGLGVGIGGFLNVAGGASKVVFIAAMTAGTKGNGPQYEFGDGKIKIVREGNIKKFVNEVAQISFNGQETLKLGKEIYYVTERCVFKLEKEGLTLIEIAPGIDLQKDILDQMEFKPIIAPDLKEMPAGIFNEQWGGLKAYAEQKANEA
jgi:propionate CoA-transferase